MQCLVCPCVLWCTQHNGPPPPPPNPPQVCKLQGLSVEELLWHTYMDSKLRPGVHKVQKNRALKRKTMKVPVRDHYVSISGYSFWKQAVFRIRKYSWFMKPDYLGIFWLLNKICCQTPVDTGSKSFKLMKYCTFSEISFNLWSGIRCLFDPGIRDRFFRISDPGSRIPNPYFWELSAIFWVKSSIILWKVVQIFFFNSSKIK